METNPTLHMVDDIERGKVEILTINSIPLIRLTGTALFLPIFGVKK